MDSASRVCWGLSGPDDPTLDTCTTCSEDVETFVASETVYLQPAAYNGGGATWDLKSCNGTVNWNLTGGADGTEVWRLDNFCGGLALSENIYRDFEFQGSFTRAINGDDDLLGFVFGYEDPGHFYLVCASGDWSSHSKFTIESSLRFTPIFLENDTNDTWRLVKVASETATQSNDMMMAIISGEDTPGQTEVLYRSNIKGWNTDKHYTMNIIYQPSINSLSLAVKKDGSDLWSQEWDKTFLQKKTIGKVGFFTHSQEVRFYDSTIQDKCII